MATGGWSGLFDHVGGSAHDFINGKAKSGFARRLTRLLRSGPGAKQWREALVDEGAGSAYTAQQKRIVAPTDSQTAITAIGGARTIETQDLKTAVLTTALDDAVDGDFAPNTYPTDASGNGGGGKITSSGGWSL